MSSNYQWEVVKGKSERKSKVPVLKTSTKPIGTSQKSDILNGVKLEEILAKPQNQNLPKLNKSVEKDKKKVEKKSTTKQANKPPKSIEAALFSISAEEFSNLYENSKSNFPDAPIVWLKELTAYLNQKVAVDIPDPVFTNKPIGYPLSSVPSAIKSIIDRSLLDANKSNTQLYFDIALTGMVTDLSKGLPAIGYRFYLQTIALNQPELVTTNLSKHLVLRNSYQNRANVTLPLLWACGHVGQKHLDSGLKVFESLMLPLIDLKAYSRFVVQYLRKLIDNNTVIDSLTREQYFLIADLAYSNKKHLPADELKQLIVLLPKLSVKFDSSLMEIILKKLPTVSTSYQNVLCDILVGNFDGWRQLYAKHLKGSAVFLNYLSNNHDKLKPEVRNQLKTLLPQFNGTNDELRGRKRKEEGLEDAIMACQKLDAQKDQTPREPYIKIPTFRQIIYFFLVSAIFTMILEPFVRINLPRQELTWFKLHNKIGEGIIWADTTLAQRLDQSYLDAKSVAEPYKNLAGDMLKVGINVHDDVRSKWTDYVRHRYPIESVSVTDFFDNIPVVVEKIITKFEEYYQYLANEIFVGQLSLDNVRSVIVTAYNTTATKTIEGYHWICNKIQAI